MTLKEIHARAGSLSDYAGYILIFFCWYLILNISSSLQPELSGAAIKPILDWGLPVLVSPVLLSGVIGAMHQSHKSQVDLYEKGFFSSVKKHFWRVFGTNLLHMVSLFVLLIMISLIAGLGDISIDNNKILFGVLSIPFSALSLFWFPAVVVERRVFRGLFRSLRTFIFNPLAVGLALLWGAIGYADTVFFDLNSEQIHVVIHGVRSGIFALLKVLGIMYALAIYQSFESNVVDQTGPDAVLPDSPKTNAKKWINLSFGFSFVSFIPLLHLAALVLGIAAMKRAKRFVLRAGIACCVGGFFTIFYLLLAASFFIDAPAAFKTPGHGFLAEENPELAAHLDLLENGKLQDFEGQINAVYSDHPEPQWVYDSALAIVQLQDSDLEGAIANFEAAAEKDPHRSEFYIYYGSALLENGEEEFALEQFKKAQKREPDLELSGKYIELIETAYQPSIFVSSGITILILLILFTLHEYGHAFAAWKLGDDTSKELGRLTLNPASHLDWFGSILLPGILLVQQSELVFGWAKPVPVNPENFQDPRRDHMRVSFAGPAINFIVSMLCVILLGVLFLAIRILWPGTISLHVSSPFSPLSLVGPPSSQLLVYVIVFLKQAFFTSLILGCFNLIPIPPLDGSWILAGLLPGRFRGFLMKTRRYSSVIFLILFITPVFDYLLSMPVSLAWLLLDTLAWTMGFA